MTKRIFRNILLVAICVFLASALLFMTVLYDYFSEVQQNQMRTQLDFASQGVSHEGISYFEGINAQKYRITWIGTDGSVLYDSASNAEEMENHFAREEVKEALAEGYGESHRYSTTLTRRYLYSAKRLSDGTVLRLAITQNSLLVLTLGMFQPILVIFAIAVILSIVLASRLSKNIVKPLNNLNLDSPLENEDYEELTPLLRRIDMQQRQIRLQSNQLQKKQNEFDTLTKGMSEGLVLLDSKGFVISINPAAESLLLPTPGKAVGENILALNRDPELSRLLDKALGGSYAEKTMSLHGRVYRVSANPITEGSQVHGAAVLLQDITEKENAEKMRREFTANVSHELKTPLQTISGCAELMANGMVKSEDIPGFSSRIYTESRRMIQLVEDIIKLSHLDEGAEDMAWEDVDMYALAEKTVASLLPEAEKAEVELDFTGDKAVLYGIPQLLGSIVYNLCDNAIKYNRKGGRVSVRVAQEEDGVVFSVADTGIGIPAEDKERIFERFYRVDKSRSKEIGGTGLGLSIVKHAARLHQAQITVDSAVGKGTTVTVKFPK
ncbi:MAG: ATP-binding protein [Faecousia sp.]